MERRSFRFVKNAQLWYAELGTSRREHVQENLASLVRAPYSSVRSSRSAECTGGEGFISVIEQEDVNH